MGRGVTLAPGLNALSPFFPLPLCLVSLILSFFIESPQASITAGQPALVEIRLADGNATAGRVEVFYDDIWGTICDDHWGMDDAKVVCGQLGLGVPIAFTKKAALFGPGTGPVLLDNVACIGDEVNIGACRHRGFNVSNCNHAEDAGVICAGHNPCSSNPCSNGGSCSLTDGGDDFVCKCESGFAGDKCQLETGESVNVEDGAIRLVGGGSPYEGRVEIFHNGRWGTVCDDRWTINNARVACKQLGYGAATSWVRAAGFGQGSQSQPVMLDNMVCSGSEDRISNCRHAGWEVTNCVHSEDVGVKCEPPLSVSGGSPPDGVPVARCSVDRGGCSHLCREEDGRVSCDCPRHMSLSEDGKTCAEYNLQGFKLPSYFETQHNKIIYYQSFRTATPEFRLTGGEIATTNCRGGTINTYPGLYFHGAEMPRLWVTPQIDLSSHFPEFIGIVMIQITAGGNPNCDGLEDGEDILFEMRPNEAETWQTLYTVTNKREEFMRGTVRLMAYLTRADQFTGTTQFRLVQRRHSGRDKDQWRLEDFAIMLSKIDPCKHRSSSCQNGGSCNRLSNLNFECVCRRGFTGLYCEKRVTVKVPDAKLDMRRLERTGVVASYRVPFDTIRRGKIVGDKVSVSLKSGSRPDLVPGKSGKALRVNGVTEYAFMEDFPAIWNDFVETGVNGFDISFFAQMNEAAEGSYLLSTCGGGGGGGSSGCAGIDIYIRGDLMHLEFSTTKTRYSTSFDLPSLGRFHFYEISFHKDSGLSVYIDNVPVPISVSPVPAHETTAVIRQLVFGRAANGPTPLNDAGVIFDEMTIHGASREILVEAGLITRDVAAKIREHNVAFIEIDDPMVSDAPAIESRGLEIELEAHPLLVAGTGIGIKALRLDGMEQYGRFRVDPNSCLGNTLFCDKGLSWTMKVRFDEKRRDNLERTVVSGPGYKVWTEEGQLYAAVSNGTHRWETKTPYNAGLWYRIEISWHKRGGLRLAIGDDDVAIDLEPEVDPAQNRALVSGEPFVYIGASPDDELRMAGAIKRHSAVSIQNLRFSEGSRGILFDTNFISPDTVTVMAVDVDDEIRAAAAEGSGRFINGTNGVKVLPHGEAKVSRGGHDGDKMLDLTAPHSYATIEFARKIGKPSCFQDLSICSMGITLQFWLKAQSWASSCCVVSNGAEVKTRGYPKFPGLSFRQANGRLVLTLATRNHWWELTTSLPSIEHWHFYELTFDPKSGLGLFIDGTLVGEATEPQRRGSDANVSPFSTSLSLGICPAQSGPPCFGRHVYDDLKIFYASRDRLQRAGVIFRDLRYNVKKSVFDLATIKKTMSDEPGTNSISLDEAMVTIHGSPEEVLSEDEEKKALRFGYEHTNVNIAPKKGSCLEDVNKCDHGMTMKTKVRFHNLDNYFYLIDSPNLAVFYLDGSLNFKVDSPNRLVSRSWMVPVAVSPGKWYKLACSWHHNEGLSVFVDDKLAGFQEDPDKVEHGDEDIDVSQPVRGDIYVGRPHKALPGGRRHSIGSFDMENIEFSDTSVSVAKDIESVSSDTIDSRNFIVDTLFAGDAIPNPDGTFAVYGGPLSTKGVGSSKAILLDDNKKQYVVLTPPPGSCLGDSDIRRCSNGLTTSAWFMPRFLRSSLTPFMLIGGKDINSAKLSMYYQDSKLHAVVRTPTEEWHAEGRAPLLNMWQFFEVTWHPVFGLSVFANDTIIARAESSTPLLTTTPTTTASGNSAIVIGKSERSGRLPIFSDTLMGDVKLSDARRESMLRAGVISRGFAPFIILRDRIDFSTLSPNDVGSVIPCGTSTMRISGPGLPKLDPSSPVGAKLKFEGDTAGKYSTPVRSARRGISYTIKAEFPETTRNATFIENRNFRLGSLNGILVGTFANKGRAWSVRLPVFQPNQIYNLSFSWHPVVGLTLWQGGKFVNSDRTPSRVKIPHPAGEDSNIGNDLVVGRGLNRGSGAPAFSKINVVSIDVTNSTVENIREQEGKSAIRTTYPTRRRIHVPTPSTIGLPTTYRPTTPITTTPQPPYPGATTGLPVRLVGGKTPFEGRVEVYYKDEWGSVCDDNFGDVIGEVVCQKLGYGPLEQTYGSDDNRWSIKAIDLFGRGTGPIAIDTTYFTCLGGETELSDCIWDQNKENDCSHDEDAGIRCRRPDGDDCASRPCFNGGTCTDEPWDYTCACKPGYTGKNCEIDVDECYSDPCRNNAECLDEINGYRCICNPGYAGVNCETDLNECASKPCLNGGSCTDKPNNYVCSCIVGFAGQNCQINIDDCRSAPCLNNAQCVDGINSYSCICPRGFVGRRCEINVDECAPGPCAHGRCVDQVAGYRCICDEDWDGPNCNINKNECGSDPCRNGAPCVDGINEYTCQCLPGYTGKDCEIDINECFSSPCQNGGTCSDHPNYFTCKCQPGYTGEKCEIEVNECISAPCLNGGTCTDKINAFECTCPQGWRGIKCEININDCASRPCQNGGQCYDLVADYFCQCKPGFIGKSCQTEVNECQTRPCYNGATCNDLINGYSCDCKPGYTGRHCEIDINECASSPCKYADSCRDLVNGYKCNCLDGYEGIHCEVNINECRANPCLNSATCVDGIAEYQCHCRPGYAGKNCEIDVDDCVNNHCLNGGTCVDKVNGFYCRCVAGWTGVICQENINECATNPCLNSGVCVDGINQFTCYCQRGFSGLRCETNINECATSPCVNGGTCEDLVGTYRCVCPAGFTGLNCEININECHLRNRCMHGSTCVDGINSYTCNCLPGYEGQYCQTNINECVSDPCQNGASCLDRINQYTCQCKPGFKGIHCETNVDECRGIKCLNRGTCVDLINGYQCNCQPGFRGEHCEINIDECISGPCSNGGTCYDRINGYTCQCPPGYTGVNCHIDINECQGVKCQNGGSCLDLVNRFQCRCPEGFDGVYCEINVQECSSGPCKNGAQCIDGTNTYTCQCLPGFTGYNCDTNINECASDPCVNGGCKDLINEYMCECKPGYTGIHCEIDVNECASSPCGPNGDCRDLVNRYECVCRVGFRGLNCEQNINDCEPDTSCYNGGTCIDGVNAFSCICARGYTGDRCQFNINNCEPNYCLNGATCEDRVDSFRCTCPKGFRGRFCQINENDCRPNPCSHSGRCIDLVNDFRCECRDGYTGKRCEIDINECESNPCLNDGRCVDKIAGYACNCDPGYAGDNCENDINECASSPCLNGATCVDKENDYLCSCLPGYNGVRCEINIDECSHDPCQNGGRCIDGINTYSCDCQDGYTGERCQININECLSAPCLNGATCTDGINSYDCSCAVGFTGVHCEINIDDCARDPCLNGGECIDGIDSYECRCALGFTGIHCEINIDDCANNPCVNGDCEDLIAKYMCHCYAGFTGANCQINIDECALYKYPCNKHGRCIDKINAYSCECDPNWTGFHCEQNKLQTINTDELRFLVPGKTYIRHAVLTLENIINNYVPGGQFRLKVNGNPDHVNGIVGKSLQVDGSKMQFLVLEEWPQFWKFLMKQHPENQGFSIMFWLRLDETLQDGSYIMSSCGKGQTGCQGTDVQYNNGKLFFTVTTAKESWRSEVPVDGILNPNTWNYIEFSWSLQEGPKTYINTYEQNANNVHDKSIQVNQPSEKLYFGRGATQGRQSYTSMHFDDISVWALSRSHLQNLSLIFRDLYYPVSGLDLRFFDVTKTQGTQDILIITPSGPITGIDDPQFITVSDRQEAASEGHILKLQGQGKYAEHKIDPGSCLWNPLQCMQGMTMKTRFKIDRASGKDQVNYIVSSRTIEVKHRNNNLEIYFRIPGREWIAQVKNISKEIWYDLEVSWHPYAGLNIYLDGVLVKQVNAASDILELMDDPKLLIGKEIESTAEINTADFYIQGLRFFDVSHENHHDITYVAQRTVPWRHLGMDVMTEDGRLPAPKVRTKTFNGAQLIPGFDQRALKLDSDAKQYASINLVAEEDIYCFQADEVSKCPLGFTITAWIRMSSLPTNYSCLFSSGAENDDFSGISLQILEGRLAAFYRLGNRLWYLPTDLPPVGQWAFYELSWSERNGLTIYINNLKEGHAPLPTVTIKSANRVMEEIQLGRCASYQNFTSIFADAEYEYLDIYFAKRSDLQRSQVLYRDLYYPVDTKELRFNTIEGGRIEGPDFPIFMQGRVQLVPGQNQGEKAVQFNGPDQFAHFNPNAEASCFLKPETCHKGFTLTGVYKFLSTFDNSYIFSSPYFNVYFTRDSIVFSVWAEGKLWHMQIPRDRLSVFIGQWNKSQMSWHPITGLSLFVNDVLVATMPTFSSQPRPEVRDKSVYIAKAPSNKPSAQNGKLILQSLSYAPVSIPVHLDFDYVVKGGIDFIPISFDKADKGQFPQAQLKTSFKGVSLDEGKLGKSYSLSGSRSYINLGYPDQAAKCVTDLDQCAYGFTITFYMMMDDIVDKTAFLTNGGDFQGTQGFAFFYEKNVVNVIISTSSQIWRLAAPLTTIGKWYFYEISWHPATGLNLFVNDRLVASQPTTNAYYRENQFDRRTTDIFVGRYSQLTEKNQNFADMGIDDLKFYTAKRKTLLDRNIIYRGSINKTIAERLVDFRDGEQNRYSTYFDVVLYNNPRFIPLGNHRGVHLETKRNQYADFQSDRLSCTGNLAKCDYGITISFKVRFIYPSQGFILFDSDYMTASWLNDGLEIVMKTESDVWRTWTDKIQNGKLSLLEISWHQDLGIFVYIDGTLVAWSKPRPDKNPAGIEWSEKIAVGNSLQQRRRGYAFSRSRSVVDINYVKFTEVHREMATEEGVRVEPEVLVHEPEPTEPPATAAPSRSPPVEGYDRIDRHYIRDNNNVGFEGLTHQQCADRCTNAFQTLGFECKSFEFGFHVREGTNLCNLSDKNRVTVNIAKFQPHDSYDYYERILDTEIRIANPDVLDSSTITRGDI